MQNDQWNFDISEMTISSESSSSFSTLPPLGSLLSPPAPLEVELSDKDAPPSEEGLILVRSVSAESEFAASASASDNYFVESNNCDPRDGKRSEGGVDEEEEAENESREQNELVLLPGGEFWRELKEVDWL